MKGDFFDFMKKMREKESSNNYKAVNRFGFLGAYQFGKPRLLDLGVSIDNYGRLTHPVLYLRAVKIKKDEFLNNPEFQDLIFVEHCRQLYKILKKKYYHFIGKTIKGVKITESGFIAGCHLVGLGGVLKWLTKPQDVKDGNGVSVAKYLQEFADYDVGVLDDEDDN